MSLVSLTQPMSNAEAIYYIQFSLIDNPSCSAGQLFAAGSLLSRPDYEDVIVERSIAGLCGYPSCSNPLPVNHDRRGRFRVSLREQRIYDLEETYKYCSEACVISSRAFSLSLSTDRVSEMNQAKIEQVLRLLGIWKLGDDDLGEEAGAAINNLRIKEKECAGAGEVSLDDWIGPVNAIDGYVPQCDRIGGSGSNILSQQNSRKKIEGARESGAPFAGSGLFEGYETNECHSKESLDAKQTINKKLEESFTCDKKTMEKNSTSETPKVKLKKDLDDYGGCDMNFTSSVVVGAGFDEHNTLSSSTMYISEMINEQLENVVLEEKNSRKNAGISRPSRYKLHQKEFLAGKQTMTKNIEDPSTSDKKTKSKKSKSYASKVELKKCFDDYGGSNMIHSALSLPGMNISEMISKQLEGVGLEENNAGKNSRISRPSIFKFHKRSEVAMQEKVDSKEINEDLVDTCFGKESDKAAVSISNDGEFSEINISSKEPFVKELEDKIFSEKKTITEGKLHKSCLKAPGSRNGDRFVKWSDEKRNAPLESEKTTPQESFEEHFDNSTRLISAEVCATALIQAAESVTSGKAEVVDPLADAGLLILPQSQSLQGHSEDDVNFKFDRGIVKWPKKTVLLDTDAFEVEDSWHDTPPEGFSLNNLSPFATMWMTLFGWINCSSLAYIYGYDEASCKKFALVNGKEYPGKVTLSEGQSVEIRRALDGFICRYLPAVVEDQRLPIPVSTLEKHTVCLLDTMSFMDAIPAFKIRQWHVIILLLIEALSVHKLPALAEHLMSRAMQFQQVLHSAQISKEEYEIMRDLILPLGRSADFSAMV